MSTAPAPCVQFRSARLPNGLEIQAEVDPQAHTAALGFFVRTGARDEPGELMGVSHFLEHMMFKGSETRNAEQVNRDFDDLGANHNAFTTGELTAYYAHVLPERTNAALGILADILQPALRAKDFDEEKGVIIEEIAMYADQPFWVGYERMMEELYRGHPLSHRVLGTKATVSALSRDQMADYFAALLDSLTEDDLLRARSRIATGAAAASERPNGRMFRLGTLWGYRADYIPLDDEVERISQVTLDDLRALCAAFPLDPMVRVVVMPEAGASGEEAGEVDDESDDDSDE